MEYKPIKKYSEATIQAELYHRLRLLNIDCILEYPHLAPDNRMARLDCVIVKDRQIVAIVEIKRRTKGYDYQNTRQFKKYSSFGVPLIYCFGYHQIDETIKKIQEILLNYNSNNYIKGGNYEK